MDDITHAALGAACAQALFGNRAKHIPWIAGALGGTIADLDFFIRFQQEPLSLEYWHRSFSHSLIFIPIGGLLAALFLFCFPSFRKQWQLTLGACLVGYATHALLDACTSYGTVLFWPWSNVRISWDIIAIIDPLFTIPLVLGTAWSVIFQDKKGVLFALLFALLFLRFNAIQHQRALLLAQQYSEQHQLNLNHIRALPNLASSTHWRVIAKKGSCVFIAEAKTPLWSKSTLAPLITAKGFSAKDLHFSLSTEQKKDLAIFSWFTDNYLILANKNPLILADGRYTIGAKPLVSLWGIELSSQKTKRLNYIELTNKCAY